MVYISLHVSVPIATVDTNHSIRRKLMTWLSQRVSFFLITCMLRPSRRIRNILRWYETPPYCDLLHFEINKRINKYNFVHNSVGQLVRSVGSRIAMGLWIPFTVLKQFKTFFGVGLYCKIWKFKTGERILMVMYLNIDRCPLPPEIDKYHHFVN